MGGFVFYLAYGLAFPLLADCHRILLATSTALAPCAIKNRLFCKKKSLRVRICAIGFEPAKMFLIGTRITYPATGTTPCVMDIFTPGKSDLSGFWIYHITFIYIYWDLGYVSYISCDIVDISEYSIPDISYDTSHIVDIF